MSVAARCTSSAWQRINAWTDDRLLERLWGEHVHLGHYGLPSDRDFRKAKEAFVHELVRWVASTSCPGGPRCWMWGVASVEAHGSWRGTTDLMYSSASVLLGSACDRLTPGLGLSVRMGALDLQLADQQFDAVWSVEAGPHMPDKQRFADELLRVMRPGGCLAVADWNRRDPSGWSNEPQRTLGDA